MPAVTYEIGARNTRLKATLKDSKDAVKDLRRHAKEQFRGMSREMNDGGGFGKELKQNLFGQMTKANLATLAITKTAGALKDGVNAVGEMVDASEQLGISAESLGKLQRVMQGAGVEVENLRKTFLTLNQAQAAAKGGDEKMLASFAELGVSAEQLQSMSLEDTFFAVADGISGISDQSEAASKAMDLLGTRNAKLIGGMRQGSAGLKQQMGDVTSITEDNAKAVDDAADSMSNLWGATKAGMANTAGAVINAFKDGVNAWDKALTSPEEKKEAAKAGAEEAKSAKQTAEEKEKARLAALAANAQRKEDVKDSERALDIAKDHTEAEKERADILRESFSLVQRYALAVSNVMEARKRYDDAPAGIQKEAAGAKLAEARQKFEVERAKKVERFGLPLAERKAAERADRDAERAKAKGERVFQGQERDRIDRSFRQGRIDEKERDRMLEELRVNKDQKGGPGQNVPEETLKEMKEIRSQMEKMGQVIAKA